MVNVPETSHLTLLLSHRPQVITSNGQLKFVSSNNQDIIFQPSGSGRVLLNGAPIQSAGSSGIKGTKVSNLEVPED